MKIGIALVASILAASPAFAGSYVMQLQAGEGQRARASSGVEMIDSGTRASSVRFVEPVGQFKKRGVLVVYFLNTGGEAFNVGPENITAQLADGAPVEIIGYDQLEREEKRKQGWARFGAALAAAGNGANAGNAGNTYGTAAYSSNTNGTVAGYGYQSQTRGTATYSGYDATAAAIAQQTAQRQNENTLSRLQDRVAAGNAALTQNLRTTTVDPNRNLGGFVTFEIPATARKSKVPLELTFTISAGSDQHVVKAIVQKAR